MPYGDIWYGSLLRRSYIAYTDNVWNIIGESSGTPSLILFNTIRFCARSQYLFNMEHSVVFWLWIRRLVLVTTNYFVRRYYDTSDLLGVNMFRGKSLGCLGSGTYKAFPSLIPSGPVYANAILVILDDATILYTVFPIRYAFAFVVLWFVMFIL